MAHIVDHHSYHGQPLVWHMGNSTSLAVQLSYPADHLQQILITGLQVNAASSALLRVKISSNHINVQPVLTNAEGGSVLILPVGRGVIENHYIDFNTPWPLLENSAQRGSKQTDFKIEVTAQDGSPVTYTSLTLFGLVLAADKEERFSMVPSLLSKTRDQSRF